MPSFSNYGAALVNGRSIGSRGETGYEALYKQVETKEGFIGEIADYFSKRNKEININGAIEKRMDFMEKLYKLTAQDLIDDQLDMLQEKNISQFYSFFSMTNRLYVILSARRDALEKQKVTEGLTMKTMDPDSVVYEKKNI